MGMLPLSAYAYGTLSCTDVFTKCFDDSITDIPRKRKCVDDPLLYDHNFAKAFWHTYGFLETRSGRELHCLD